jgi:intein/homing endonuclease
MDTDGSINSQGVISIGLKYESRQTLLDLKLLLNKLGIANTVYDGTTKLNGKKFNRTILRIRTRKSRENFARLIGFTEPDKQTKLMSFVHTMSDSSKTGDFTSWPLSNLVKKIYLRHPRPLSRKIKYALNTKNIPHNTLMQFINCLKDVSDDDDFNCLQKLAICCRPCQIKSIILDGHEQVFDLEVTGDHEYSTGGLFSHNCEKSADVITYTYLNDALRKDAKFYLGCLKNRDNPVFDRMVGKILWLSRRMRAIESNVFEMDNAQILDVSKQLSISVNEMII